MNRGRVAPAPALGSIAASAAAAIVLLIVAAASVRGQADGPALPLGAPAASPDTASLVVAGPAHWAFPRAARVDPDTMLFGSEARLVLTFAERPADFAADSLSVAAGWVVAGTWEPVPTPAGTAGVRDWSVAAPVRVYRVGPLQVAWQSSTAPVRPPAAGGEGAAVLVVLGRAGAEQRPAAVRDPRPLGWNPLPLAALALLAALMVAGAVFAWRGRRRRAVRPWDRPLAAPPDLETASALRRLVEEDLPGRGEGRRHLDRLAGLLRAHLAGRYRLPAGELTADEIEPAARRLGHHPASLRPWERLLAEVERRRYDPAPIAASTCARLDGDVWRLLEATRLRVAFTPVALELRVRGERDRAWLQERLGASGVVAEPANVVDPAARP
ncbi:MAG: hypothetical protein R6X25_08255 [Candidatus Krumholzibacteriia bacterium]